MASITSDTELRGGGLKPERKVSSQELGFMNRTCLQYRLSSAEHQQFEQQGYLVLEGVLESGRLRKLVAVVDRITSQGKLSDRGDVGIAQRANTLNFVGMDAQFIDRVDYPQTFPKVWKCGGSWGGTFICITPIWLSHFRQRENLIQVEIPFIGTKTLGV